MKEVFNDILDKNEEILNVYKPNKLKLFLSVLAGWLLSTIWIFVPIFFAFAFGEAGADLSQGTLNIVIISIAGAYILFFIIAMLFTKIYYNNLYFAYSNKRIIIRKGIIGVDYKSLDMAMIGAVNVNVSVLDKILKQNTGSITFGSMASPVATTNAGGYGLYRFSNIQMPYEKYREVKTIIDEFKESKK